MRPLPLFSPMAALLAASLAAAPASALDCRENAEAELQRLAIDADQISAIRYVEKINPSEQGPGVLGVRAWVRLRDCSSGHLVIDMTRSCFVRQSYTRGECRRDGVIAY
jgi:hypothetical protein